MLNGWEVLVCGPFLFLLIIFILSFILERKFPSIESRITLSLISGLLALIPGLTHLSEGLLIVVGPPPQVRGWPFPWLGYEGLDQLFIPSAIAENIIVVALITFVSLSLAGFVKPQVPSSPVKAMLYPVIALIFIFFPWWGKPIVDFIGQSITLAVNLINP